MFNVHVHSILNLELQAVLAVTKVVALPGHWRREKMELGKGASVLNGAKHNVIDEVWQSKTVWCIYIFIRFKWQPLVAGATSC